MQPGSCAQAVCSGLSCVHGLSTRPRWYCHSGSTSAPTLLPSSSTSQKCDAWQCMLSLGEHLAPTTLLRVELWWTAVPCSEALEGGLSLHRAAVSVLTTHRRTVTGNTAGSGLCDRTVASWTILYAGAAVRNASSLGKLSAGQDWKSLRQSRLVPTRTTETG